MANATDVSVQAKLTVGQPGDRYECEADSVAERVVAGKPVNRISRLPAGGLPQSLEIQTEYKEEEEVKARALQRQHAEEEEEELQARLIQRQEEEEEELQMQPLQRREEKEEEEELQMQPLQRREEKEEEEELQMQPLQRREEKEEEEELQMQPLKRREEKEEEEPLQLQASEKEQQAVQTLSPSGAVQGMCDACRKETKRTWSTDSIQQQEKAKTPKVTPDVAANIGALQSGGNPLPGNQRADLEQKLGADFSQVRVHTDSRAADTAKSINARAFTIGRDISFGAGQYAPESRDGKRLLGHELTHVVQQGAAPIQAQNIRRQEEVEHTDAVEDTGEAARRALEGTTGQAIRKPGRIAREQYLRQVPDPRKGENVTATLQFNTSVFVEVAGGHENGWYRIVTETGKQGWVPRAAVALDMPEPNAELYKVKSGDRSINLAGRWYGPPGGWKLWWWPGSDDAGDARFYVGALAFANKGRAGMPSPADLSERSAWKSVHVVEGLTIWKPSKGFLRTLRGKVSSGSITKELWEDVKKVAKAIWEFVVFAAAFIAGLLYGAGESVYDLFAGVVDLAKIAWSIGKSLFTGNIITDAKKFWEDLKKIDISKMAESFRDKWLAPDPWDAGFFQGRVLGYVIMEIVMLVASGGILTALKWSGKFAKIGALIAKLPRVAKVVEGVKGTKAAAKLRNLLTKTSKGTRAGKKIPGKHALLLVFRRAKKVKKIGAVSLKRLRNVLGRAGVSPRPYKLRKVPKAELKALREAGADVDNIYGWMARDGAGNVLKDFRGRPIINFTDKGLSSLEEAVKTFGHEVKHIRDFAAGMKTSSEALAELAGEQLWVVVQKSLKKAKRR